MRHPIDLPKLYLDLEFAQSHSNDAVLYTAPLAAPTHHITAPAQPHATNAVVYMALLLGSGPEGVEVL